MSIGVCSEVGSITYHVKRYHHHKRLARITKGSESKEHSSKAYRALLTIKRKGKFLTNKQAEAFTNRYYKALMNKESIPV